MKKELTKIMSETLVKYLKHLLLIQKQFVESEKENGTKTYTLEEYNKIMNAIAPTSSYNSKKINNIEFLKEEITKKLLLTEEEIDELCQRLQLSFENNGIQKHDTITNAMILIRIALYHEIGSPSKDTDPKTNKTIYEFDKWYMLVIEGIPFLGINPKFTDNIFHFYNTYENVGHFFIYNFGKKYKYIFNEDNSIQIEEIENNYKLNEETYLAKNLYIALSKDEQPQELILNKQKDSYQKVWPLPSKDKVYKETDFKNIIPLSILIDKLSLPQEDFYRPNDFYTIIELLDKLDKNKPIIENLVNSATDYLSNIIFNNNTKEKQELLEKNLKIIIQTNLLKKEQIEIDIVSNQEVIYLLNKLNITPSFESLTKTININLEENKITVTDKINNKEEVIYSKNNKKRTKEKNKK